MVGRPGAGARLPAGMPGSWMRYCTVFLYSVLVWPWRAGFRSILRVNGICWTGARLVTPESTALVRLPGIGRNAWSDRSLLNSDPVTGIPLSKKLKARQYPLCEPMSRWRLRPAKPEARSPCCVHSRRPSSRTENFSHGTRAPLLRQWMLSTLKGCGRFSGMAIPMNASLPSRHRRMKPMKPAQRLLHTLIPGWRRR
jgi:hypothetical protein